MIFLKPTVLRDAASAATLSVDRYDLIRTQQQATEPAPNPVLPVQGVPVLPPLPSQVPTPSPVQPASGAAPAPLRP